MNLKQAIAFAESNGVTVSKRQRDTVRRIEKFTIGAHHIEKPITSPVGRGTLGLSGLWTIHYQGAVLLAPNDLTKILRLPVGQAIHYAVCREVEIRRMSVHGLKPTPTMVAIGGQEYKIKLPKLVVQMQLSNGSSSMTVYVKAADIDTAMENARIFFNQPTITFMAVVDHQRRFDLEF